MNKPSQEVMGGIRKALKAIPDIGRLLFRLARDPRVSRRNKIIFVGVAVYLAVPFDIIPDFLPGIGHIDDIVLIALALDAMLNRVPKSILEEHWSGDEDVLETLREVLHLATTFVPDRIKARLFTDSGER